MVRLFGIWTLVLMALFLVGGSPAHAQSQLSAYSPQFTFDTGIYRPRTKPHEAEVAAAIRAASLQTGVSYEYLLAQAQLESGLDPNARARTSSASGLFQFIDSTWLSAFGKHSGGLAARQPGLLRPAASGPAGKESTELSKQDILALRYDPKVAALVAAGFVQDNAEVLQARLGRAPTNTELYLAHFLGSHGAARFVTEWQRHPHRAAASHFAVPARANRAVFYAADGSARSFDAVLRHFEGKLYRAMAANALRFPAAQSSREEANLARPQKQVKTALTRYILASSSLLPETLPEAVPTNPTHCNHIMMCYEGGMNTSTITRVRELIAAGEFTKAGLARAAGLHANTLRDATEADWNPTAETLGKLQSFLDDNDDAPVLVGIAEIIEEARNGRMYILVDDEDRENEGDLIIPAQMATPDAVNFMATHGRGLICLALDRKRVEALGLAPMSRNNQESMQTAFTVSIEAREGVTTGISAADRARTISVAIDASKGAEDIVSPGHVFPLTARDGGVLVRAGHTEAAVDISRLAGLNPSGVICEIMNEDGTMARLDDLMRFARKHSMKIGTIRDLIEYRMRNDHLVERASESALVSDYGGDWRAMTYRTKVGGGAHVVLQKGHIDPEQPTLVRMHSISVFDDVLGQSGPRKRTLQRAMGAIGKKGAGVIVVIMPDGPEKLQAEIARQPAHPAELRNYGIGAQILVDLGVKDMELLTDSPKTVVGLEGYGLHVVGQQPIPEGQD
ncbi:MAG: 3,4-dihydroxy-2-butanone-4-phosphate synthase [Sphingomonadaceae bacterium]|nr:3,4-dihydroxy-2-butanone-4-phosphate synthase [Sphingomonadaceae bacterium]